MPELHVSDVPEQSSFVVHSIVIGTCEPYLYISPILITSQHVLARNGDNIKTIA